MHSPFPSKLVKTGALHAWAFHPISIPSVGEIHNVSTMLKEFRLCRTRLGENVSRLAPAIYTFLEILLEICEDVRT